MPGTHKRKARRSGPFGNTGGTGLEPATYGFGVPEQAVHCMPLHAENVDLTGFAFQSVHCELESTAPIGVRIGVIAATLQASDAASWPALPSTAWHCCTFGFRLTTMCQSTVKITTRESAMRAQLALALAIVFTLLLAAQGMAQGTPCLVEGALPGTMDDRLCVYLPFVSRADTPTPTPPPSSTPDPGPWTYSGCRHMLVNGSFEDGPEGWQGWNEFDNFWTQPVASEWAVHGSIVARSIPREGGAAGRGAHASISQSLPKPWPPPNLQEVRAGAWIRTVRRDVVFERDFFKLVLGEVTCGRVWAHSTRADWQHLACSMDGTAPFQHSRFDIIAADYGDDGFSPTEWHIDAVSLEVCLH